jgi:hypothetical protein
MIPVYTDEVLSVMRLLSMDAYSHNPTPNLTIDSLTQRIHTITLTPLH